MSSDKSPGVDFVSTLILLAITPAVFMVAMGGLHDTYPAVPAIGYWTGLNVSVILVGIKALVWPGRRD